MASLLTSRSSVENMIRREPLAVVLCCLLAGSAISFIASLVLVFFAVEASRDTRVLKQGFGAVTSRLEQFSDLQTELGYTHFIHDFKNGVLRRDPAKLDSARDALDKAVVALRALEGSGLPADDIQAVEETLEGYRSMTDTAASMIADGATAEEIDRAVRIDDGPADAAMERIIGEIVLTRDSLRNDFERQGLELNRMLLVVYGTAGGLGISGVMLVFLFIGTRRNARKLDMAVSGLQAVNRLIADRVRRMADVAGGNVAEPAPLRHDLAAEVAPYVMLGHLEKAMQDIVQRMTEQEESLIEKSRALEETNEELTRFTYVASHDLQEPLRKIQSNISLIGHRHGAEVGPGLAERLERLNVTATGMRRLIDDLLAFSRAGSAPLKHVAIDLGEVVNAARDEYIESFTARGGDICIEELEGAVIDGDRTQMLQVFMNLLSNAAKFARDDLPPSVRITGKTTDDLIHIKVIDNGIGFDEKFAEQIFEPFQRLHGKGAYAGTGIGLSIVRKAINRHGGTVTARPAVGGGAEIRITLPLKRPVETEEAA